MRLYWTLFLMFSTLGRKYETPDRIVCSSEQLTVKTHFFYTWKNSRPEFFLHDYFVLEE